VSRHRFLVAADAIVRERVTFSEQQAHQLRHVLRLKAGDRVRVFDGVQPADLLVELAASGMGTVVERCPQAPEPRTRLIAYPALLQRDKFEAVLQKLTEIGAFAIAPMLTSRGLVRQAPDAHRIARWQAIVREATEQCGRGFVPELRPTLPFSDGVQQATREGTAVLAYEGERLHTVRDALRDAGDIVAIFVGPEGGYTTEEAQSATSMGARLVTLGPRILRTETASPLLAALVLYERGDLSSSQPP
jgi:16S rRNA (uracil1498-N3)-methyltransferase